MLIAFTKKNASYYTRSWHQYGKAIRSRTPAAFIVSIKPVLTVATSQKSGMRRSEKRPRRRSGSDRKRQRPDGRNLLKEILRLFTIGPGLGPRITLQRMT